MVKKRESEFTDQQDQTAGAKQTEVEAQSAISEEDLAALQRDLDETRTKAEEYLDGWQRSRAEFTNFKKRIEREQSQTYQMALGSAIRHFLGVADDLERALKNRPTDGAGAAWADGIELIYRKLLATLEGEGVMIISAEGEQFDPNFHEAVVSEENSDYESGQVIEVLQQGYQLGDKILRPAMVRVAR